MLPQGWGLDIASLNNALTEAKRNGITLRALVFINPGNPTGNCLTVSDLQQLVRFAYDNRWDPALPSVAFVFFYFVCAFVCL